MTHSTEASLGAGNEEGWIEWHGGICPVSAYTKVDVRFRDGDEANGFTAERLIWAHPWNAGFPDADIVAYRLHTPSQTIDWQSRAEAAERERDAAQARVKVLEDALRVFGAKAETFDDPSWSETDKVICDMEDPDHLGWGIGSTFFALEIGDFRRARAALTVEQQP